MGSNMRADAMDRLRKRGAADLEHPGGDLLTHLVRTGDRLRRWGALPSLVTAGRWHAAYGTDGFATALFSLDERALVVDEIGEEAEVIVYRYGSCDRGFVYPQLGQQELVRFRDRYTGEVSTVDALDLRMFAELTVANELDVMVHSDSFRRTHGSAILERLLTWAPLLSAAACADVRGVLTDVDV
jgi:hypothetical protein